MGLFLCLKFEKRGGRSGRSTEVYIEKKKWVTWLGRRYFLFRLRLHGFKPCQRQQRKWIWVTPPPPTEDGPSVQTGREWKTSKMIAEPRLYKNKPPPPPKKKVSLNKQCSYNPIDPPLPTGLLKFLMTELSISVKKYFSSY